MFGNSHKALSLNPYRTPPPSYCGGSDACVFREKPETDPQILRRIANQESTSSLRAILKAILKAFTLELVEGEPPNAEMFAVFLVLISL